MKRIILTTTVLLFVLGFNFETRAQNNFLHFDGNNDYTQIPSNAGLQLTTTATWEIWINSENASSNTTLYSKHTPSYFSNGYYISLLGQKIYYSQPGPITQTLTAPIINSNTWYHIAIVKDGANVKIYVDGNLEASGSPHAAAILTSSAGLHLGAQFLNGNPIGLFKGSLDEFRVWNTARTQTEIQSNMNIELTGTEAGLLVYHNFNQGTCGGSNPSETTLTDLTSNGNSSTLLNFALTGCTSNWVCSGACPSYPDNGVTAQAQAIPTLSQWGLIIFTLLLLCSGTVAVWNQRFRRELA